LEKLPASIDQVYVFLSFFSKGSTVQYPAFAVVKDRVPFGHVAGHQGGDTDAQVNVGPIGQLFGHPHGYNFPVKPFFL